MVQAAIAHLWFVTIHPFADGNGRMARTLADMQLARADGEKQRFYSLSVTIRAQRKDYYRILEATQRGTLNITNWLFWFIECFYETLLSGFKIQVQLLDKLTFWHRHQDFRWNARQRAMVTRLLDGFTGKLTATKWAQLTKCSHDTALRDINHLIAHGVLIKTPAGGRSTSYEIILLPEGGFK